MDPRAVKEAFALSALLQALRPEDFSLRFRRFAQGEYADDSPDGVPCIGLIAEGRIAARITAPDGSGALLNVLGAGDCFGISNLMDREPLETQLQCLSESSVIYLPKAEFRALCRQDGGISLRYATLCSRKVQFLLRRLSLLTMQTCRAKLVSWLLLHADAGGEAFIPGSRESLAESLAVSRAALFRELRCLQSAGLIRSQGRSLLLVDREALEGLLFRPDDKD